MRRGERRAMQDVRAAIVANDSIAPGVFRLRAAVGWERYEPGQFVMVGVPGDAVFLRRPFGIAALGDGVLELCYAVVGRGTAALSQTPVGASVSILGPCGKGFVVPASSQTAVLVAGGYGIAPLLGLARQLRGAGRSVHVYAGAKDFHRLLYLQELEALGVERFLATEDGSVGERGMITERLGRELSTKNNPVLFICGPHGLLEAAARMAIDRNLPAQASLETSMACGIGVCQGCVCKDARGEYVRICREGPVFDVRTLRWDH